MRFSDFVNSSSVLNIRDLPIVQRVGGESRIPTEILLFNLTSKLEIAYCVPFDSITCYFSVFSLYVI